MPQVMAEVFWLNIERSRTVQPLQKAWWVWIRDKSVVTVCCVVKCIAMKSRLLRHFAFIIILFVLQLFSSMKSTKNYNRWWHLWTRQHVNGADSITLKCGVSSRVAKTVAKSPTSYKELTPPRPQFWLQTKNQLSFCWGCLSYAEPDEVCA